MPMPNNIIFVRHGHSEGNLATELEKRGDDSMFTPDFRERPGHRWKLTPDGEQQARTAGEWIKTNFGTDFFRYYVSTYIRTRQTAGLLNLPNAQWMMDRRFREREWGDIDSLPLKEFKLKYPDNEQSKRINGLYWRPPGGESIADVGMRVRSVLETFSRECEGQDVLVVTHGEFMWAIRAYVEYMTDEEWVKADKVPSQKIHNTQIFHYSRIDPETGQQSIHLKWVRRICPSVKGSDTGWIKITPRKYTNEQLLAGAKE
jgi:broad specificity phosphatase PhoE